MMPQMIGGHEQGLRIHYYMQFFPGPDSAGSRQPFTLSKTLAERGHEVVVVAGNRNLDTGANEPSFCLTPPSGGSVQTLHVSSLPGGRGNNLARLASYGSFMSAAFARGLSLPRPDVVIGSIPSLFTGLAALAVAGIRKVPFLLEVRDFWPDALVVKKAISQSQAKPLSYLTDILYQRADRIVSITPGIKKELTRKGIPDSKVHVFPNGFDPELFCDLDEKRKLIRGKYGWGDHFVAIYAGSYTAVTAMDVIIRAAARIKDDSSIRFELFGNGPTRKAIERLAQDMKVSIVTFHDPVPKKDVPGLLAASDAALMSLFKTPLAHIYFENKFVDYMGAGKPILAAMDGEQAEIIAKYRTGRVVDPADDLGLARVIVELAKDRRAARQMGERARSLVHRCLQLPNILEYYSDLVEAAATGMLDQVPTREAVWQDT